MFKRILSFMLVIFLLQMTSFVVPASSGTKEGKSLAPASKIKADVMKLGQKAHVKVKFYNNTRLYGVISRIETEHFVVTDETNQKETTIAYKDLKEIKKNNLSTVAKIGIGAAIAGAIVVIIAITGRGNKPSGKPCPLIYPERCP